VEFNFLKPLLVMIFGIGLTSMFWVPSLFFGRYEQFCGFNLIEQLFNQMPAVNDPLKQHISLMIQNSSILNMLIALLAYFAIFTRGRKNNSIKLYYAILIIVFLMDLKIEPLWKFLNNNIPFFYNIRYPERFITFFGMLFYPVMIGYSLESIFTQSSGKLRVLSRIVGIIIISIIIYIFYINQKLSFADPVAFSKPQPKVPISLLSEKDKRIAIFRNEPIWVMDNWTHDTMWTPFLYNNGRKLLTGDDQNYIYKDFVWYLPHDGPGKVIIMGLMNTKYIMTKLKIPDSEMKDLNLLVISSENSDFFIYENKKCLPRILLTKGSTEDLLEIQRWSTNWVQQIPFDRVSFIGELDKEQIKDGISFKAMKPLKVLMNDEMPLFKTYYTNPNRNKITRDKVVPETAMLKYPLHRIKHSTIPLINGTVNVLKERDNYIKLKTRTMEDTILVYVKANWPGWEAKIDGVKQELFNTNGIMVGLFLPKGDHEIEIKYGFPYFYLLGIEITLIVLLIFLLVYRKDLCYYKPNK
jgi:hypothetical protein